MTPRRRLSDAYIRPRGFERDGRIYGWLGVRVFKRLLLGLVTKDPAGQEPPSYLLPERSIRGVRAFEKRARRNELIHLAGLLPAVLGLAIVGFGAGWVSAGLVLVFAVNFHPYLLQRDNRARIARLLERREWQIAR